MKLAFLDRERERTRLQQALTKAGSAFICLYGRRRLGKSRLLRELCMHLPAVYYVGDEREGRLQIQALAQEIGRLIHGFGEVSYPDWDALLNRWMREAPPGAVLVLDEFPYLAQSSPELPGLLQKRIDRGRKAPMHWVVCGSSQRTMQGLVLDVTAPLYGRATEIVKIAPLEAHWIRRALRIKKADQAMEAYAVWGGVPRYWELAADAGDLWTGVRQLVLDPLGPLHEEPARLLLDDMRDIVQPASILALAGAGCHRMSEIAGRIGKPASSLSRPIARLAELGYLGRDVPFGIPDDTGKRSLYRIADPFLSFWFRYVEPARSRLEAGQIELVEREIRTDFPVFLGRAWEEVARRSAARLEIDGRRWLPARRWWGPASDRAPMEVDLVSESADGSALLVGEVRLRADGADLKRLERELRRKIERLPVARDRLVVPAVFRLYGDGGGAGPHVVNAAKVFDVLN